MSSAKPNHENFDQLKKIIGDIDPLQLQYVDCFPAQHMAMFMPIAGPCLLAISHMHTHPSHMFVINFADSTSIVLKQGKYRAQPNTVAYLPPNIPHHEVNETEIPRYVAILIDPLFMEQQAKAYNHSIHELEKLTVFPVSEELLSVVKRFIGECKDQKAGSGMMLEALSVETVHILLRSMLKIKDNICRKN